MLSDYNFISMTEIMKNFPLSPREYTKLVVDGKLKKIKHRGAYKHSINDVFALFYPENEKTIVKKWSYPYEDIDERWNIIRSNLKGFPVCFLILNEEHEKGIYRVYDRDKVLKFFAFIEGNSCILLAYNRDIDWDFKIFMRSELVWK